jgi:hypothetical protein
LTASSLALLGERKAILAAVPLVAAGTVHMDGE